MDICLSSDFLWPQFILPLKYTGSFQTHGTANRSSHLPPSLPPPPPPVPRDGQVSPGAETLEKSAVHLELDVTQCQAGSAPSPSHLYTRCVSTRVQTDLKGLHWREKQAATIQKVEKDEKQVDLPARHAAAAQGCVPWLCPLNSSCSPITHLIQPHLIPEPGQMVLLSAQSPPLQRKEGRRGWPEGTLCHQGSPEASTSLPFQVTLQRPQSLPP